MRIAFLVDTFPVLSETFILNQMTGLIDLGHEITIVSAARPEGQMVHEDVQKYDLVSKTFYHNEPQNKYVRAGLFIILFFIFFYRNPKAFLNSINVFKYGREATSLNYFYKVLLFSRLGGFDIIQCHYGHNGNLAAVLKELGIPGKVVTMFHGYDIRRAIDSGGKTYGPLIKNADAILAISDHNFKYLAQFGFDPAKIISHPVGIDLKRYRLKDNGAVRPLTNPIRIITVCRLVKEKGIAFGLQTIAKLVYEHRIENIEYQIVGEGPLREELEQLVATLKIKAYVRFLGPQLQTDVFSLLSKAHIFFLPSIAEVLPVVLMEAHAVGLPIVATRVGSVDQIVKDKQSGYLVASQDVDSMTERLKFLLEHHEEWPVMGKSGRAIVEKNFDVSVLNKRLENIYRDLCSKGNK
ncbi:MAG: glycosyltransferase [Candidatus Omnitrophica bacterium]|nr:glycosyltransferase [Candidatus Omnitrophota bacterium]